VLFWVDSNHIFIEDPQIIIDFAIKNNIFCHDHYGVKYLNKCWTCRDTFVNMGCDELRYWNSRHLQVNTIAFLKNKHSVNFIEEWKNNSLEKRIILGEGKYPNLDGFKEHRHEQSIFSILVEKYKIPYQPYPINIVDELMAIDVRNRAQ
jgi:hypothetical protein